MRTSAFAFVLFLAPLEWTAAPAIASEMGGPFHCARCGCRTSCVQKTCQLVCDVKKETKSYLCVESKDVCLLKPSCRKCGDCCECPAPRCGEPICVKKLMKKQYQVEHPVQKCVVVYLCPDCAHAAGPAAVDAAPAAPAQATPAPLPPKAPVARPAPKAK